MAWLCYRAGGCADIITMLAASIDVRQFNPAFPQTFRALCRTPSGPTALATASTSATATASMTSAVAIIGTVSCLARCDRIALRTNEKTQ